MSDLPISQHFVHSAASWNVSSQASSAYDYLHVQLIVRPGDGSVDQILNAPHLVEQDGGNFDTQTGQGRLIAPVDGAKALLRSAGWLQSNGLSDSSTASVSVEVMPQHGSLIELPDGVFRYTPNKDYLGKDFFSFLIKIGDKRVRLSLPVTVVTAIHDPKGEDDL